MTKSASPPSMTEILNGVDPDAVRVVRRLLAAGHEAYLVGGCVRDLYLRRRPKDFDIATSATPETIRKLFRNSRIIGRRFKLAHVFFGNKIIETSTFRTEPPETDDDDPLIRHDNEWGSVEDDARRRDFTINGLFFDVETVDIVDFVDGLADLDARVVRTIGDPETRFREDPVRMIRAIKFAARLDFDFDEQTWDALLEVVPDIAKCSRARVLEEIYKLLRGGSARRSFELLLEAGLLEAMMPEYVSMYGDSVEAGGAAMWAAVDGSQPDAPPAAARTDDARSAPTAHEAEAEAGDFGGDGDGDDEDEDDDQWQGDESDPLAGRNPSDLLWRYLEALDDYSTQTHQVAANGVLQAVLFAPLLSSHLNHASRQTLDRRIDEMMNPVGSALGIARRDRELARQILMAHRRMITPSSRRRRRSSLAQRQYFHDALIFLGIAVQATGDGGSELARWKRLTRVIDEPRGSGRGGGQTEPEGKRRRRRGGRRRKRSSGGSSERSSGRAAAGEG